MTGTAPAPLRIVVGEPTEREISPDLWGIFLEDINWALDGGLNADLVQNGGFEYGPDDHEDWGPLTAWTTEGAVRVRRADPLHPENAVHARLDARGAPARLGNLGYDDGITAPAGRYRLALAVRRVDDDAREIRADLGGAAADVPLGAAVGAWAFVDATLDVVDALDAAELRLELPAGVADVDVVSLRPVDPATGEPRTFRADLVAALAGLAPAFVRFPGGCIAHGYGLDNLYHWKSTVGPRHQRRHLRNVWGYHQSMAIGYFEYFELCEALDAAPVPVVAAGVCCQNIPGRARAISPDDMPAYIQDVLDLVEFANGAPDTTWGALRAEMGHPEPFGLRYVGVGNEDEITAEFRDRFVPIHDALRAEHPEITVIGTSGPQLTGRDFDAGWAMAREQGVAVVDEHGYRTPHWFHQQVDRYDAYDRTGPAVYVGEYAARSTRLRSALAEAAWMVGLERNGDVVRLASYAPLLARVGGTAWQPDLLYFTATDVRPTASYHVQRMFAQTRGDRVCEVTVAGADDVVRRPSGPQRVRLSSRGADVTWTDVEVDGVRVDDVRTTADGAARDVGAWPREGAEISAQLVRTAGTEGVVLTFGGDGGASSAYTFQVGSWENKSTVLTRTDDGLDNEIDGPHPFRGLRTGVPRTVRVRSEPVDDGTRVRAWVDEALVHDVVDVDLPEQRVVAGATARADGSRTVRVVNASPTARETVVDLPGTGRVHASAETLSGPDPDEGEPFETWPHPPVTTELGGDGRLEILLPPWSVTAVTIHA
ncbi:alpha-L-arabinofuranosidase C-terminal domain-containing protein [Isoptericola variabilis]|uniref:alpha-L-arabinofuranosidase C-terminal domain-containing protein n=1 Tax=Isoptericola variabilis TaxID=139208 RepID=UPI003D252A12